MANQYNSEPATIQKCKSETCPNMVRRTPSAVKRGAHEFCSVKCATSQPRKFKEADAMFILANAKIMTMGALADHFGISANTFYKLCHNLRSKGWAIPMGDGNKSRGLRVTSLTDEQKSYVLQMYATRCVAAMAEHLKVKAHVIRSYVGAINREAQKLKKKGKPVIHKRVIPMAQKKGKISNLRNHQDRKPPVAPPKRKEETFKTRKIDESGLIPVVFNDKNKTKFMARDEAHADRIRATYAYLNKPASERFK